MRKINLSKELLRDMYTKKLMSLKRISEELGVSRQTVSNKLSEYDIPIRNSAYTNAHKPKPEIKIRRIPSYQNREKFEKAYRELKSIDLLAKYFGVSQKTAFEWKKRHNLATLSEFSQQGKRKSNIDKPYTNKEWLEEMYSKYSWEDLGKMLGCNPTTLSKWGVKFNIKTRNSSQQWITKSKFGNLVLKGDQFDLVLYNKVYCLEGKSILSRSLRNFIISLYAKCECCGYSEVLDLHHIDEDHGNNSPKNHAVLCPNCHAKIHRLGIKFEELVSNHISWDKLLNSYQEAK